MRPLLKVGPLHDLQDARSSAAVGFDLIAFSLERGHPSKMSAAMIWNIANWLSGPELVLELNQASLSEVTGMDKQIEWRFLSLPGGEQRAVPPNSGGLILRADEHSDPEYMLSTLQASAHQELVWELSLPDLAALAPYQHVLSHCLLNFRERTALFDYLNEIPEQPFGFSLGKEMTEESGLLDYEQIDDWLMAFFSRFPSDTPHPHLKD